MSSLQSLDGIGRAQSGTRGVDSQFNLFTLDNTRREDKRLPSAVCTR